MRPVRCLLIATVLFGFACLCPLATWYGGKAWLAHLANNDPTPNQNAMLLVFLGFIVSIIVGVAAALFGLAYCVKALDSGD